MKLRMLVGGFALGAVTTLVSTQVVCLADDEREQRIDEMMRNWTKYALPGPHHEKLEYHEGEWNSTYTIWMEGPGKPPVISKAVVSNKLIFGGRFLETRMRGTTRMELHGEMMEIPVEAVGYLGYDNFKEKYVSIWIGSDGTQIHYSEGLPDATGNVITYYGTTDDWASGQHDKPFKMVSTIVDENSTKMVLYDLTMPPGKDRIFEEVSTRRKVDAYRSGE